MSAQELAQMTTPTKPTITKEQFRAAMGSFAAGVTVITTLDADGTPHALTATAFSSLSADPPLCLVCVDKQSRAHEALTVGRRFAVNMLGEGQHEVSGHFASRVDDKFDGKDWQAGEHTGCPLLPDVIATVECEITEILAGGDHDIFIGLMLGVQVHEGTPLVYWRGGYAAVDPAQS